MLRALDLRLVFVELLNGTSSCFCSGYQLLTSPSSADALLLFPVSVAVQYAT